MRRKKCWKPAVIRISGHIVSRGIDMVVEDNGPGMDEDILAKLESGEVKPEGLGIGMRNIHRRVRTPSPTDTVWRYAAKAVIRASSSTCRKRETPEFYKRC